MWAHIRTIPDKAATGDERDWYPDEGHLVAALEWAGSAGAGQGGVVPRDRTSSASSSSSC